MKISIFLTLCVFVLVSCGENIYPMSGEVIEKDHWVTTRVLLVGKIFVPIDTHHWQVTIRKDGEIVKIEVKETVYDSVEVGTCYLFLSDGSAERKGQGCRN